MLKFRGRRIAAVVGLFMGAILITLLSPSVLDDGEPDRQRMTLEDLRGAECDRIVVQLQDPALDRLSPSVVDAYQERVAMAGENPPRPLVVLRSDDDGGSPWQNRLLIAGASGAVVAALLVTWWAVRRRVGTRP